MVAPFRNVRFIGESTVSDNLEANVMSWMNWNLLGTCAFYNVTYPTSGSYGGAAHKLTCRINQSFDDGQLWEGFRKQWVWQSGVDCATQPIQISGVYVNNVFRPVSGVGPYSFKVDYPNGRIVFNSAISTHATVTVEFSFNHYQLYTADSPFWKELQRNSFRIDDSTFNLKASGYWAKPPELRLQLPCVIMQATRNIDKEPYQLGNLTHFHRQDIRFHVFAETNQDLKWITDTITGQFNGSIAGFDNSALIASGIKPMDMNGYLQSTPLCYPDLVRNFPLNNIIYIKNVRGWDGQNSQDISYPLFMGGVQYTLETILN